MTSLSLLIGTTKGAFLLDTSGARDSWRLRGPFCDGWPINHMAGDPETGALWAGGGGDWHGAGIWRSTDDGATWTLAKLADGELDEWLRADPETAAQFGMQPPPPAPFGKEVSAIWSLQRHHQKRTRMLQLEND